MFQHLIDERESGVGALLQRSNLINVTELLFDIEWTMLSQWLRSPY